MTTIKFKITDKRKNQVIGYEWIKNGKWFHQKIGETQSLGEVLEGTFESDDCEYFERSAYAGIEDSGAHEIYEGDTIRSSENPKLNKYKVVFHKASFCGQSDFDGKMHHLEVLKSNYVLHIDR